MYAVRLADAARADMAAILGVGEYEFGQRALEIRAASRLCA